MAERVQNRLSPGWSGIRLLDREGGGGATVLYQGKLSCRSHKVTQRRIKTGKDSGDRAILTPTRWKSGNRDAGFFVAIGRHESLTCSGWVFSPRLDLERVHTRQAENSVWSLASGLSRQQMPQKGHAPGVQTGFEHSAGCDWMAADVEEEKSWKFPDLRHDKVT